MPYYKHKDVRHDKQKLHQHPSHPYPHPMGRWHLYPPTSRIKDRKGKHFRHTAQELIHRYVKGTYTERSGRRKPWD